LTEEVGYPPSPLATPGSSPGGGTTGGGSLGQTALKAVSDVLGWKPKAGDIAGFLGALTQSFTLTDVEGHTESKWTPRTYAVQTDLAGGISGAQASILDRASEAVNRSTPLLDGLYALDVNSVPENVDALKAVLRSQFTELVNELGYLGGPRVSRVEQIFSLLLDPSLPHVGQSGIETEPDYVGGQLGQLRDDMGLWSVTVANHPLLTATGPLINTVEDEQNVTNFRIMVDYVTSLRQSWNNNRQFFGLQTATPFFGTQLVLLSRQLSVVADAVDEVRFTMDSVFITPSERQTLEVDFHQFVALAAHPPSRPSSPAITATVPASSLRLSTGSQYPYSSTGQLNDNVIGPNPQPLFVEDLLSWVQRFASEEGPRLIQTGGKYAVGNTVLPVVVQLRNLVLGAARPTNAHDLPRGYMTPRVHRAWKDLASQLDELAFLANPISFPIPPQQ
jgi:hypothetical protein